MLSPNASKKCSKKQPAAWAINEFKTAKLPDKRHKKRLVMIATDFGNQPTASIPQACGPGKGSKAAYRFFENEDIKPQAIRQAHHDATLERVRKHSVVLAIQDTTALNYSHHPKTKGLGLLGSHSNKTLGFFLHSTLALTTDGEPLGMLHNEVLFRDPKLRGKAKHRHRKPTAQKESHKWLEGLSVCQALAPQCASTTLVTVADREGDLYDLFAQALAATAQPRVHVLVRSRHNRMLPGGDLRLWDMVSQLPAAGRLEVRVGRKGNHPARLARLEIRFSAVTLQAPTRKAGQGPIELWAIEAREIGSPQGESPILWRLVTTLPVTSFAGAVEKVQWYAQRWQIEVIHKVLKSGCQIEQRQLETRARLERALSVDLVVACRLLALARAAREQPEASVSAWLGEAEWKALCCISLDQAEPPSEPPSVRQAVRWIAQLGGFMGRKADGQPGPITLWRGFHRLNDLTAMWQLCRRSKPKRKCG